MIPRNVSKLKTLLERFPCREEISFCFAYGSAVFDQSLRKEPLTSSKIDEKSKKSKMIDLVLAVDDSLKWHAANMNQNPSHYSSIRYLGPKKVNFIQKCFGGKVHYNTLVPIGDDSFMKYGVISTEDLINDLLDWETLYISGRLHKPVLVLQDDGDEESQNMLDQPALHDALRMNRQSALHAALLLLPERFSEEQLYVKIAGLSYSGDFRMWFGEDRSKVEKIVRPQISQFRHIYSPLLKSDHFKELVQPIVSDQSNWYEQNCSRTTVQWHLNLLPKTVQYHVGRKWLAENTQRQYLQNDPQLSARFDVDDLMCAIAYDVEYRRYIRRAIQWIVFQSSTAQTIKGFFTAGPSKSVIYSWAKVKKMVNSLQRTKTDN